MALPSSSFQIVSHESPAADAGFVPKGAYPLVSIGIPTYNRADRFLQEALRSALEQTYPNIEVIVSDNCSKDDTERVVQGFRSPRLRYFRHETNIGANNNFNFCLEQARGEYFQLLQDDDTIDRDYISTCLEAAAYDTRFGIIRTGTRLINSQGDVAAELPNCAAGLALDECLLAWFGNRTSFYLCSTLFNTAGLREMGGFGSRHNLFQDVMAEVRLAARLGRVDVREAKASFRKHDGEMTFAARVGHWCEDSIQLLDILRSLTGEKGRLIEREGMRFLAGLNYKRARAVRSPVQRLHAYFTVYRAFRYQWPPPKGHLVALLAESAPGVALRAGLRRLRGVSREGGQARL